MNLPSAPIFSLPTITPWSLESLGAQLNSQGLAMSAAQSTFWFTSNAAIFVPFTLSMQITAQTVFWYNGVAGAGNADAGIYDVSGNLLGHCGTTVTGVSSTLQSTALLTPATFGPGVFYLALSCSTIGANTLYSITPGGPIMASFGCAYKTAAMPLPANVSMVTIANIANAKIPVFGIAMTTVI